MKSTEAIDDGCPIYKLRFVLAYLNIANLRVGTLDSLIALGYDLLKSNSFVERVSQKIRRQIEELERISGVMPEYTNPLVSVNGQNEGGGTRSQFSSAMWTWMDSIPSTPASACEGPLNRTFVRMSSLSRIRLKGMSVTASKVTVAKKRMGNRGFLLLSIVGALCAILWVFIIATVGVRPVLL
ncbi:unnamed protein product [Eruca vesicaria subsp. sativa]|uniref:V-type proton ATPase subunit C n=1 Tax=Eruca vesicaria subsp. sativa TaxID=29727 RepID=A0ABC8L1B5_ERUVS|nr:unnamed protein product [Eruca vesicaria subsp. sativa]